MMIVQRRLLLAHQVALPQVGQVVLQFFWRQGRQVGRHAAQIQLWIDPVTLALAISDHRMAWAWADSSCPANSQFLCPTATRRRARSATLLSMPRRPSLV